MLVCAGEVSQRGRDRGEVRRPLAGLARRPSAPFAPPPPPGALLHGRPAVTACAAVPRLPAASELPACQSKL